MRRRRGSSHRGFLDEIADAGDTNTEVEGIEGRAGRGQHGDLRRQLEHEAGNRRVEVQLDEEAAPADGGDVLRGDPHGHVGRRVERLGPDGVADPDDGPQAGAAEHRHGDVLARVGGRVPRDEAEVAPVAVQRRRHAVDDGDGLLAGDGHGDGRAVGGAVPGEARPRRAVEQRLHPDLRARDQVQRARRHAVLGVVDHHAQVLAGQLAPPEVVVLRLEELVARRVDDELGHGQVLLVRQRVDLRREDVEVVGAVVEVQRDVHVAVVGERECPVAQRAPHVLHALAEVEHVEDDGHDADDARVADGASHPRRRAALGRARRHPAAQRRARCVLDVRRRRVHGLDRSLGHGEVAARAEGGGSGGYVMLVKFCTAAWTEIHLVKRATLRH